MPGHQLFDLSDGSIARRFEPIALGFRSRYAGQLAYSREADLSGFELPSRFGQLFERFGNSELLLRDSRSVSEETLRVLLERAVAEPTCVPARSAESR
jgi:hypothetical protein